MMRLLFVFLLLQSQCFGGSIGLIEAKTLMRDLESYQVIDVRPAETFEKGHIPRSTHMMWEDWTQQRLNFWNRVFGTPAKWGKVLLNKTTVQERLRALGLSSRRPFVVVGTPKAFGEEGRVAWNLLVWGAESVFLLNGGFPAWVKHNFPVVEERRSATSLGDFEVALQLQRIAPIARVQSLLKNPKAHIYDARSKAEFEGKKAIGQKRGGHIPGAKLVNYASLYAPDGYYVDRAEFKKLTQKGSGASYCTGGVRSALLSLLYEIYWSQVLPNYDGSMWEWAAMPNLPLSS